MKRASAGRVKHLLRQWGHDELDLEEAPPRPRGIPGKRTLVEARYGNVARAAGAQRRTADESHTRRIAESGVAGSDVRFPHLDLIQRAFGGHDLGNVKATIGGPAADATAALGAQAYATDERVAFAEAPSLFLAAHEAAHIVQQRQG